jgi:hypothetical protein
MVVAFGWSVTRWIGKKELGLSTKINRLSGFFSWADIWGHIHLSKMTYASATLALTSVACCQKRCQLSTNWGFTQIAKNMHKSGSFWVLKFQFQLSKIETTCHFVRLE